MKMIIPRLGALLLAVSLSACSMVPEYAAPNPALPASYQGPASMSGADAASATWWTSFKSPELDTLMTSALKDNLDIAAALARIEQSRGALRSTRADYYPQADLSGSASRDHSTASGSSRSVGASASLSYALDPWGLTRAQSQSASALLDASVYDAHATSLLIQSNVASTYFTLLNLKDRLAIAQDSLKASRDTLNLVQKRFDAGLDSGLTLAQQRSNIASIEATIPGLQSSLNSSRTALAILLGLAPEGFDVKAKGLGDIVMPQIATGQPSLLLTRRPDILKAEADLRAANADIGAARAAFFPTIDLGATIGELATFGAAPVTSNGLSASLLGTIFSAGRLEGNLSASKARYQELAANYQSAVLTSLKDVEDALVDTDATQRQETAQAMSAEEAFKAYWLSQESFKAGLSDFLSVLDAQRSWLSARDSAAQAALGKYDAAVTLFVALGGGWES